MTVNVELYYKCMLIETLVKTLVLKGVVNNRDLVEAVNDEFCPKTIEEQEMFSEAIIYAKQAILN